MQIGCLIIYDPKNCPYLEKVSSQFDCLVLKIPGDFSKKPEHEYRNDGLFFMKEFDYVWIIDADEILFPEIQKKILKQVKKTKAKSVLINIIDYVDNNFNKKYVATGHKPVVLVDPKEVFFYATRCIHGGGTMLVLEDESLSMHHLGYFDKKKKSFDDGKFEKRFKDQILSIEQNKRLVDLIKKGDC
jgi:hypothetical protein